MGAEAVFHVPQQPHIRSRSGALPGGRDTRRGNAADSRPACLPKASDVSPSRMFLQGLSPAFGVLMVVATQPQPHRPAFWIAGLAISAVAFGVRFRSAATLAVLLTAVTLALTAPPTVLSAASGLTATAYL